MFLQEAVLLDLSEDEDFGEIIFFFFFLYLIYTQH